MRKFHLALVMLLALGVSDLARAAAPTVFSVQGVLRNNSGQLQSMVLNVTVSFFNVQTGGTALATYNNNMVQAQNGLFTFNISDASIGGVLQAQSQLWMEVTVAGFGTFPRTQVTSQLYSLSSASADALSSACVGCVADSNIGGVAGSKVSGTVASANNFTGQLAGDVIGPQNNTRLVRLNLQSFSTQLATNGQVLQFIGGQWTPTTIAAGNVSGTGTTNTIPIWNGANQLGNATINIDYTSGGRINLTAGGANYIDWNTVGIAPPSSTSVGWKLRTWDNGFPSYGVGIDSSTQWYVAGGNHDFYTTDGSTYTKRVSLNTTGITVQPGHVVTWENSSQLVNDQGGSIELGGNNFVAGTGIPYIDFHVGGHGVQDFNVRLINDGDQQLSLVNGNFRMPPDKRIFFQNPALSPPNTIGGWRMVTNQNGNTLLSGVGVDTNNQWYVANGNAGGFHGVHTWYTTVDGTTYTRAMQLVGNDFNSPGGLTLFGTSGAGPVNLNILNAANGTNYIATFGHIWATGSTNTMSLSSATGNLRVLGSVTPNTTPDVAETIPAANNVSQGDVVCSDPSHVERAIRCERGPILGVISDGTSGVLINSHGHNVEGKLTGKPLVLAGRVPVKVTLENGPIQIGDLLTLSSTPGVAMRMTAPGPQVGIALAPFDGKRGKTGTVLTFVKVGEGHMADEVRRLQTENAELRARLGRLEQVVERLAATVRPSGMQPASYHR